jgi:uncharacterized membrane protein
MTHDARMLLPHHPLMQLRYNKITDNDDGFNVLSFSSSHSKAITKKNNMGKFLYHCFFLIATLRKTIDDDGAPECIVFILFMLFGEF